MSHFQRRSFPIFILFAVLSQAVPSVLQASPATTVLKGVPFRYSPPSGYTEEFGGVDIPVTVAIDGKVYYSGTSAGLRASPPMIEMEDTGRHRISTTAGGKTWDVETRTVNGLLSILPPLIAIVFALAFRQVIVALLAGVWLGSFILWDFQPLVSLLHVIDYYIVGTLSSPEESTDHVSIVIFTLLLGGMVGITSRMGGMQGIVNRVSRLATTPKRGQLTTWFLGVLIFFDDYTNTLIVGTSMRPLTDRLRISREKLSYIVDSTAAPVTVLAVITSWIGFQISLIGQSFVTLGVDRNPFGTFISAIPYNFYPIFAVLFVLIIVLSGRDYSLMYKAERRARKTGRLSSDSAVPISDMDAESISAAPDAPPRFLNGVLPIAAVIIVTVAGLIVTGRTSLAAEGITGAGLLDIIKESDSFKALLWGSFSGCIIAMALALGQRLLNLTQTVMALVNGIKSMVPAMIILVLAWCIGKVCSEIRTADYLVHHLSGLISPRFLPMFVFLLAVGISFSTGTSWGTMSILTPIVIPLVYGTFAGEAGDSVILDRVLYSSIAAILAGAVFGDHCSPISDTTIMSSMASGADHVDHVRTQLPYALTVGFASVVFGYLLLAAGLPVLLSLACGTAFLLAYVRFAGKPVDID
jgi:Na+/H+ antiporter NhaC